MKSISERSLELFKSGYFCSESILIAAAEKLQIESDLIPRIATSFGSGLANSNGTCGAVPGAIMAISLFNGRSNPTDSVVNNFELVNIFLNRFKEEFRTINCYGLTKCKLSTEEGRKKYSDQNVICKCNSIVEKAGQILDEIFEENIG